VWDVLEDDGTLWLNIDDSYGKNKQLLGIPWRVAFGLQSDGWFLRQDIIWSKTNPKPEPMWGRCARSHEYLFLFAKNPVYYFDSDAIRGPINKDASTQLLSQRKTHRTEKDLARQQMARSMYGENATQMSKPIGAMFSGYSQLKGPSKKSVWSVARASYSGAHMAVFPPALIEPCILAGSKLNDIVLDPFMGSGTTAQVAQELGRQYLGCELNLDYLPLQDKRVSQRYFVLE
jgi:DNA modification methylase